MPDQTTTIDGFPVPVRRPTTAAEIGELVREAVASNRGIYPVGGGTQLGVGYPPTKPGTALDLTGLNRVIDYPARDMTVTVQAGITVAELQKTLAAENQWLPIDVPNPETATVGGSMAANVSGPRRLSQGTFRDYLLGVSFVTDAGEEVKAGGRVVKNVAGYDLMKLHTGAFGTLGVLTQLTLKVKPRPEVRAIVTMELSRSDIGPVLNRLHTSKSRPAAVELATDFLEMQELIVAFEEKATTARWQVETLLAELRGAAVTEVQSTLNVPADPFWSQSFVTKPKLPPLWMRAIVPPSRLAEFVVAAEDGASFVAAHALSGVIDVGSTIDNDEDKASVWVHRLEGLAHSLGGFATVRRCPPTWKANLPVWGRPRGDWPLMKHVKQTLDPNDVFNPGRMFRN